jgi:hypothetical protein
MFSRISTLIGVFVATALLGAPSALAASPEQSPPGSNGYHSAYYNYLQMTADKHATGSAATIKNGVTAASSAWSCGTQGWIASRASGLYISTEALSPGDEKGMLRARATSVGPWEMYQICGNAQTGAGAIWADGNAKWVTTEIGDQGLKYAMLRARSSSIGPWEEYQFAGVAGAFSIWSHANALWVSAELGYSGGWYGMIRARSGEIGAWESFAGPGF